ncbi:MAG TPA: hypothetical protein PKK23_18875 [Nitrospirales bacterium]|nr:hypothetical protein [Nitrospiraceae bacterium]HNP31117.1 hypothetical protein [Nitrospirales bacterium]
MKNVILITMVSLLVFGGFVMGLSGPVLAGTDPHLSAEQLMKKITAPGVEFIFIVSSGHMIEIVPPPGITFRKPKTGPDSPPVPQTDPPPTPGTGKHGQLPEVLQYEVPAGDFKMSTITLYGEDTCVVWNGQVYCVP